MGDVVNLINDIASRRGKRVAAIPHDWGPPELNVMSQQVVHSTLPFLLGNFLI
jgi:hypothetical protein